MSIRFESLSFTYSEERRDTLADFNAEFRTDRITILTGPSGCGKSTLLYLAAGIYPHNAGVLRGGRVTVAGEDPAALPPQKRCALVGIMFQNPELQFCMDTVRNELIFCLENIAAPVESFESKICEALAFCEIPHLEHRTLNSLSGGERQKAMLACLTINNPRWLLLDEPFANIDEASALHIAQKLRQLHDERGTGVLAVDHRLDHWMGIADSICVFRDGRILEDEIDPKHPDCAQLERLGVIAPGVSYHPEIPECNPGEAVLTLEHLSLKHGDEAILEDVNASFASGKIYAIVGESGCGKSSLFGALSGLYKYDGAARLGDRDVRRLKKKELGSIGFVTQSPQDQFVADTVRQEILLSLRGQPDAMEQSEVILRRIGLWAYRDVSAYILSQGQQRRLGVAALLAYPCRVLVCDEPTYAQDRANTIELMRSLCSAARERRIALIFSTHDRQLARDYADEILELKGGRLHEVH